MIGKLFAVASVCLLVSATGCDSGGGKKAKITSFTASPTILPTAGGEVTLTWQVTGAESVKIEPGIGLVTGTSHRVVVTETTDFVLVARRDGNARRERATVTVTAPNMVVGTVRSMISAVPVPDAIVVIAGHEPVVTDASGMFAVADVATPYQLSLVSPDDGLTVVYAGLTRFDPTIDYPLNFTGMQRTATVSGTVPQAVIPAGIETRVSVDTTVSFSEFFAGDIVDDATGAYSVNYAWNDGPTSTPAKLHGLRYNDSSPITTYMYGTAEATLTDGVVTTPVNLTLTSAGIASTAFTYTNLEDFAPEDAYGAILFGTATGTAADEGFLLPIDALSYDGLLELTMAAPDLEGASLIMSVAYSSLTEPAVAFDIRTVPVGAPAQVVELLPPPRLLLPVAEGSITRDSPFAVSGHPQSAKMFMFDLTNGDSAQDQTVIVVTTENAIPLPDLTEIGVNYDQMTTVEWSIFMIGPRGSTDEVTGPGGILGDNPQYIGFTDSHFAYLPTP